MTIPVSNMGDQSVYYITFSKNIKYIRCAHNLYVHLNKSFT